MTNAKSEYQISKITFFFSLEDIQLKHKAGSQAKFSIEPLTKMIEYPVGIESHSRLAILFFHDLQILRQLLLGLDEAACLLRWLVRNVTVCSLFVALRCIYLLRLLGW